MKIVKAYVRVSRAAQVVQALHKAGVPGLTVYVVHGTSAEVPPSYHGLHPFDPSNLPETAKVEVICEEDRVEMVMETIAHAAKTGYAGDGIITVEDVEKLVRIRDVK
jgi:nitrogen regulatory protein PII